jgi:hypothetical protein
MWQYTIKVAVTAVVVVAVAELAKRGSVWSAVLASLPLTSLLAFVWLYLDTNDSARVAALAQSIFWLVLPSLVLFLLLPALLRAGWAFWPSLAAASAATALSYVILAWTLARSGIRL